MLYIDSEVSKLNKVIIHRPDDGIEWVTPDKAIEYLYDDIVFLKKMREEHDIFSKVLRLFLGKKEVYDTQNLLSEILTKPKAKSDLVNMVCKFEGISDRVPELLKLKAPQLAYTLLTGSIKSTQEQLFAPIANYIFCRDIGVMIKNTVFHCEASKEARFRETLLSRAIFEHSSLFASSNIIELSSNNVFLDRLETNTKHFAIEGGDIMMVHPDHLLIGHSERTNLKSIEAFAQKLFDLELVKTVSRIDLPKERYCMHLDTLITFIDHNECVAFEPIINSSKMPVTTYQGNVKTQKKFESTKNLLEWIFPKISFLFCGGGVSPFAEREQWTDGCNLFAVRPGVALAYDRNVKTAKALEEKGYQLIHAKVFIKKIKNNAIKIDDLKKTIILIPSNELSRARGGTHCLTFPISREAIV